MCKRTSRTGKQGKTQGMRLPILRRLFSRSYAHAEAPPKERDSWAQEVRDMLTRLLTIWPDDVEALIDLAQLTAHIDAQKSLELRCQSR
ncbi:unnamed protein product, partial [Mesorhabditis belari]|uniref:Uncharacterized protein n=1 Tax=Mesorhabditis belari TaxID=2138241 RepID=A0AAF3F8V3_9BILA